MAQRENKQPSGTAAGVAMLRAIESEKPEGIRICYDPYSGAMSTKGLGARISKWIIQSGLYDRMSPGALSFVVGRERYIDDYLIAGLRDGLNQVVLLGAGFDTRAYRIPGIEKTRVFEIDQPATQELKLVRLKKVIDPLPGHVTFVPVNFNTQTLGEQLLAHGYNERGKTLFIWQGVTYFLTVHGVDNTLAFIANHSGPGSSVIFDYFYSEALRDTTRTDLKMMRRAARMTGEEYLFGIDEGRVEEFLAQRGFSNVRNLTFADLKPVYFTGANAERKMPKGLAIASATVAKGAG
jgi:methyltransferase (TIGR00027 family)